MCENVNEDRSLRDAFLSDVNIATQRSIADDKPLVIMVEEFCQATKNDGKRGSNLKISHLHYQLFEKEFVGLAIQKPSTDFDLLSQIFPQVQLLAPPSLIAIYRGCIIHSMVDSVISLTIGDFLADAHEKSTQLRTNQKLDTSHQARPSEDSSKNNGGDANSGTQGVTLYRNKLCSSPKRCNKSSTRKQCSQIEKDKKRIPKLAELDRIEKQLEANSENKRFVNHTQSNENREPRPSTDVCLIQVKLVDGITKRMKFSKFDKLSTVREIILKSYREYQQIPFQFFKPTERLTYSQDHEDLMLEQLQLDRCTLILKPIDPFESHNDTDHQGATSSYHWLKNKILSFVGYGGGQVPRSPANHVNVISSVTKNNAPHSPILDSESDTDTIYHSPEIRSLLSRSSSPLEPSLNISSSDSNFDLNGVSSKFLSNPHYSSSSAHCLSKTRNGSLGACASASSSKGNPAELLDNGGDESGPKYVNVEDHNDDKLS
ncbi:hypothetical protein KL939_004594 [Ogataea angusta]|nr:hypothetical protein KL939_004594 [Ogataea angusta]